ncbi:MAG TPA: right-handed parallel beta-helix repeat-containing protein [Blastocatellia bacterium]|nr:right-handed parallel beta-helix repeat-containing protein [Blastocatellia bacterium]
MMHQPSRTFRRIGTPVAVLAAAVIAIPTGASVRMTSARTAEREAEALPRAAATLRPMDGVRLGEGSRQRIVFRGPSDLVEALATNNARPLSMVDADFDRDGVRDVACAYALGDRGVLAVFLGNSEAIYPRAADARRRSAVGDRLPAPFRDVALVSELDERPDRIAAGDFDADGRMDLAVAADSASTLQLIHGKGDATFDSGRRIGLDGPITALAAGDIGSPDRLAELAIGVERADGPCIVVLGGRNGAAAASPRTIACESAVTSFALGHIQGRKESVLVAGTGRGVTVVGARSVETFPVPFDAKGIALCDVDGSGRSIAVSGAGDSLAMLSAGPEGWSMSDRWSESGCDTLVPVRIGQSNALLGLRMGARASLSTRVNSTRATGELVAAVALRLDPDGLDDVVALEPGASVPVCYSTYGTVPPIVVTTTADDGDGSLRSAIFEAGSHGGGAITFDIPGEGTHTISLQTALPDLLDPITIDATSQPGFAGTPVIEIDCAAVADAPGLAIGVDGCVVRGLAITRAGGSGVSLFGVAGCVIEGNYIGVAPSGSAARSNALDGITVTSSSENLIGGTVAAARNVVSGNGGAGIALDGGSAMNVIAGNYVGTNAAGTAALANASGGVNVTDASMTVIGGASIVERNVISGNGMLGVGVFGSGSANSVVLGDYIGTDFLGLVAVGNEADGVLIQDAPDATVGGTTFAARNVLSGNGFSGVAVVGSAGTGAVIIGNTIGANSRATTAVPNTGNGVYLENAVGTRIGGPATGEGNIIAGNEALGVGLFQGTTDVRIQGNTIGLGADAVALPNGADGVYIQDSSNNLIGGQQLGEPNVIASNGASGVLVFSGERNAIVQNSVFDNGWIGIDIGEPGITTNDDGDVDDGGNTALNFPVMTLVASDASTTVVRGVYNGSPGAEFRLEFFSSADCDPFGFGEGRTFLGATSVTTDGSGVAMFDVELPVSVVAGSFVSSTATDAFGNTSEFSECAQVQLSWDPPDTAGGPPRNLQVTAVNARASGGLGRSPRGGVTGYRVYKSRTRPVAPVPSNLFTSVPPSQTSTMAPSSAGSFFVVTATYPDGSESTPSNDASTPGAPIIGSVSLKGTSKVVANGSNFTTDVMLIADGIPFALPAKLKRNGTRVIQKGTLLTSETLRQFLASRPKGPDARRKVMLGFRNDTGATTTVILSE